MTERNYKIKKFKIENKFEISDGNLKVLETIPKMMMEKEWRTKLRRLVLDYYSDSILKSITNTKKCSP